MDKNSTEFNLRYIATHFIYMICGSRLNYKFKISENKRAPFPAYDLYVKEDGKSRGRVVFSMIFINNKITL
jgi:hypothetical protein